MTFLIGNIANIAGISPNVLTITFIINILVTILVMLATLGIGLWLRRLLVKRLEKTVLDNWVVQTLGVITVFLPLFIGAIISLAVWSTDRLLYYATLLVGSGREITTFGWRLLSTVLLVALSIGIARTIQKLTVHNLSEKRVDINIRTLFGRIFYILTMTIAGFWILSVWQVPLSMPVTVISVLTVAVSFAVQDILKDLVAGFYILLERPFYIGDQISITVAPTVIYIGKVEDVQLRATKIRLLTGEEASIPNAIVFGNAVINNTYYGERRSTVIATIPQEEYVKGETINQFIGGLKEHDMVMAKPEPSVQFTGYTEGKIRLTIRFWIASGQTIDISDIMYTLHTLSPQADLLVQEPSGIA
jgi:small conductance mechanosensitive channel